MDWLQTLLGFIKYLLTAFVIYGILMAIERLRPAERRQPLGHIWFNVQWYVVYSAISLSLGAIGLSTVVDRLHSLNTPHILVPAPQNWVELILVGLFYLVLVDFFYYWFHRLQHTTFLWEQHKFHHSEVSLNVTSTQRVHWLEEPLVVLFVAVPVNILFRFQGIEIGILALIELLWLQFVHLNLRLELGMLTGTIVGPQHHRLHHSFEPAHINKNYAVFFPMLDMIFGTYYRPKPNEFPATGLTTGATYNNLWAAFLLPFRAWWRSLASKKFRFKERWVQK
jgi:sterol desaturase/sphingolipid hydroxylase (fatty acid hydroxylase superfamily)